MGECLDAADVFARVGQVALPSPRDHRYDQLQPHLNQLVSESQLPHTNVNLLLTIADLNINLTVLLGGGLLQND